MCVDRHIRDLWNAIATTPEKKTHTWEGSIMQLCFGPICRQWLKPQTEQIRVGRADVVEHYIRTVLVKTLIVRHTVRITLPAPVLC